MTPPIPTVGFENVFDERYPPVQIQPLRNDLDASRVRAEGATLMTFRLEGDRHVCQARSMVRIA